MGSGTSGQTIERRVTTIYSPSMEERNAQQQIQDELNILKQEKEIARMREEDKIRVDKENRVAFSEELWTAFPDKVLLARYEVSKAKAPLIGTAFQAITFSFPPKSTPWSDLDKRRWMKKTQQVHPGNVPTRGPTSTDYLIFLNKLMIVFASSVCCVYQNRTSSPPTKIHPPTCGRMSRKMSDCDFELACLGRPFQLGMFYDCRRDVLIPGITLWDAEMLQKNINVKPQPNTEFKIIASDSSEDKVEALNVSASLEASFLCGLVSVKGSASFLSDKKKSKHQSRVTLQYRTTTSFEQLTMEHLGAGNFKHCNVFEEGSATHVVTALLYGAQAFFIFDREVSSNDNYQDIQGELQASIKKIPLISIEGEASLKMSESEQEKTNKFSCTFHGDFALENNPVSYSDAIKVYSELPKLLGANAEHAVPMTVWLYPLKKLDSAAAQLVREISVSLVRRAQRVMDELDDCDIQCQDLMKDNVAIQFPEIKAKLRKFKDLCSEYKLVFQKQLSQLLPSIRGGGKEEQELVDVLNSKERSPFQGALITEYLQDRQREINVVRSYLDIMKDVPALSSSNDLDKMVLKATNDYVIVFALSSLNEKEQYITYMENYLRTPSCFSKETLIYDPSSTMKPENWFTSGDVTALNRENIQAFLDFKQANDGRKNIEFCIASIPDELTTASSIHVYERGRLVSSQYELPSKPPKPTILNVEHDRIHLQITPPEHGTSCVESYSISYQSAQSSEGTDMYTKGVSDRVTVKHLEPHKEYQFSYKAVCRPGVSLSSDVTSFFRTRPCAPPGTPIVKRAEAESATVFWDVPTSVGEDVLVTEYVLEYREHIKDQENEISWKSVKSTYRECTLQQLNANTDYAIRVLANCGHEGKSFPSPETVFSTSSECAWSDTDGCELFLKNSTRIHKGNPSIHALNLHKKIGDNVDFSQYVFGKKVEDVKNKVILLLGSTGGGKTTLVNVMINYILGTKWQDGYRFKLINEVTNRTQAESQTSIVSSYELYNHPGFQIPYSLTIVDTPGFGDTRGMKYDKLITEQVKSFLCSPLGIDHIDAVCFVVQASLARLSANQKYIFDSILSIFGKDIEENIMVLVTFADGKEIPVLEAIKAADLPCQKNKKGQPTHFKFNNSGVFADKKAEESKVSDNDSDEEEDDHKLGEIVWRSTFKQMKAFFKALGTIESKSLALTIKVLEERERLQKAMASLTPQITAGLSKLSEIKKFKQFLKNESENMEQNENFEKDVEVVNAVRTLVNCFTMNCNKCFFTCHSGCFLPAEDALSTCAVMGDDGYCVVCPENCHYTEHLREKVVWSYETKLEKKTINELKDNFMKAKGKFMDSKQMLDALEEEFHVIEHKLMNLIKMSSECLRRLDEIALKPQSLSTADYLEILIKTEEEEKKPGFEERIIGLVKMKQEAIIVEKIGRGENLLEKEHQVMVERKKRMKTVAMKIIKMKSIVSALQSHNHQETQNEEENSGLDN
ncbi:Stonustoxin subunit alpha [Triplophysa tibetana]|uniref:Stonustoxin subunit alpha n=1 Tax=Triplophysa tibetana TaxID=1572043 RepID=A0A5A9P837_9TELE|nr:Stonustoxin subunit alpha [Triplophysa tibetana]